MRMFAGANDGAAGGGPTGTGPTCCRQSPGNAAESDPPGGETCWPVRVWRHSNQLDFSNAVVKLQGAQIDILMSGRAQS